MVSRKTTEMFLINYYKENKPKGVTLKQIKLTIEESYLADLTDEVRRIKQTIKKSKVIAKAKKN